MDIFHLLYCQVIFNLISHSPIEYLTQYLAEQPRNHKNQDDDHHCGCQIKEQPPAVTRAIRKL